MQTVGEYEIPWAVLDSPVAVLPGYCGCYLMSCLGRGQGDGTGQRIAEKTGLRPPRQQVAGICLVLAFCCS